MGTVIIKAGKTFCYSSLCPSNLRIKGDRITGGSSNLRLAYPFYGSLFIYESSDAEQEVQYENELCVQKTRKLCVRL